MTQALRVGIVGASAKGGWAKSSHVPAVQGLEGLELVAIAGQSQSSADEAAQAFHAKRAYGNASDMFRDPEVDIVSVAVKVPDHQDLVLGALRAGKHVYCEWPLGRDVRASREMDAAAQKAGVHTAIGLQTRQNPAGKRAAYLLKSGSIGRMLSARVYSATGAFGPDVPSSMLYAEDEANGVTLVTVQGAHTIDFAIAQLGAFKELSALLSTQYSQITLGDDKNPGTRHAADHMLINCRFENSAALSIETAGGRPPDTAFWFDVVGDKGVLVIGGGALRGFQSGRLRVSLNGQPQAVDEGELASMPDEAVNVAGVYAALRDDILQNTRTVSDFAHAVRLAQMIEDVQASAKTGTRIRDGAWPVR